MKKTILLTVLKMCDPMQIPLQGETGWREMERAYFNP